MACPNVTATAEYDDEGYRRDLSPEARAHQRIVGAWDGFSPEQARDLFDPLNLAWWVVGGWALEAFTGISREHEDIDVSMFRRDLPALRSGVSGRYHVWAASNEGLCPLADEDKAMPGVADQVWLRAHALAPWRVDVLLNPDDSGRWVSRREPSYTADLDDVTWRQDGIRYARPEVVLGFKAKAVRPKDEADFTLALPLLDVDARRWLRDFLDRVHPGHVWRSRL